MMWTNLSQVDRVTYLEAIVRQALQSKALLAEMADALYALSQRSDLSDEEQRLLHILNDAITQEDVLPDAALTSSGEPVLNYGPQTQAVPSSHNV